MLRQEQVTISTSKPLACTASLSVVTHLAPSAVPPGSEQVSHMVTRSFKIAPFGSRLFGVKHSKPDHKEY
mgnify:CR=1 FL=1